MKKTMKCLFLSLALLMTMQAVNVTNTEVGSQINTATAASSTANSQLSIWGTYSMEKVLKAPEYNHNNPKLEAALDVAAANGETESGQIIITTGDIGVNSYVTEVSDLTNENGDVYSAENVEVYNQWYVLVSKKSNLRTDNADYFPAYDKNGVKYSGWTPDALIPQKYSIEAKENYIDSNANQGITFDFYIPVGTPTGEYTGEFSIKIDGKTHKIPVKLTVWGFDVSEAHGMNLWDIGEGGDAPAEMTSDFESLYVKYYDALLKYKLNAYHLADFTNDEEVFVEDLRKYWDDPAFNGVFLPDIGGERSKMYRYFAAIAKASVEDEENYFEAVRFYHQAEDEPQLVPGLVDQCVGVVNTTNTVLAEIANELQNETLKTDDGEKIEGFNQLDSDLKAAILESIIYMPQVVTSDYTRSGPLNELVSAYCPKIGYHYESDWERRMYERNAEVTNGESWCYTSWTPQFQNPNFHVDDFLYAGRVIGWMRKDYNIYGYLNWMCNLSVQAKPVTGGSHFSAGARVLDPYTDPLRLYIDNNTMFTNGDGYLFYPMAKYHADSPIPSMRLVSAREAQEDFDMLWELEEAYNLLASEAGYNVGSQYAVDNLDNAMSNYYESLYNKNLYTLDGAQFEKVRRAIGGLTEAAYDNSQTMIMQTQTGAGEKCLLKIYSQADEVYVNGHKLTKDGKYYAYTANLKDRNNSITIKYVLDGVEKSFAYLLPNKLNQLAIDESSPVTGPSKGTSTVSLENGVVKMEAVPYGETAGEISNTRLDFTIPFAIDFREINNFGFEIKNISTEDLKLDIYVKGNQGLIKVDTIAVFAYETYMYETNYLYSRLTGVGENANSIVLRFSNFTYDNMGNKIKDTKKTAEISNFSYSLK